INTANFLPPGSTAVEVFDVFVNDGHGGTAVQHVSIEIDGPQRTTQTPPPSHPLAIMADDVYIDQHGADPMIKGLTVTDTASAEKPLTLTASAKYGTLTIG